MRPLTFFTSKDFAIGRFIWPIGLMAVFTETAGASKNLQEIGFQFIFDFASVPVCGKKRWLKSHYFLYDCNPICYCCSRACWKIITLAEFSIYYWYICILSILLFKFDQHTYYSLTHLLGNQYQSKKIEKKNSVWRNWREAVTR